MMVTSQLPGLVVPSPLWPKKLKTDLFFDMLCIYIYISVRLQEHQHQHSSLKLEFRSFVSL